MTECYNFKQLPPEHQEQIRALIRKRIEGKSHIADTSIMNSDIPYYRFKVEVLKYNTVKGWAVYAYIRYDRAYRWVLTFNPRARAKLHIAGRTGSYG